METRVQNLLLDVRAIAAQLDEIESHLEEPDPEAEDDGELVRYHFSLYEISLELGLLRQHIRREVHAPFAVPEYYEPVFACMDAVSNRASKLASALMHRSEMEGK